MQLLESEGIRRAAATALLGRGLLRTRVGDPHAALEDLCRAHRISETPWVRRQVLPHVQRISRDVAAGGVNPVRERFLAGPRAEASRSRYAQGGAADLDLFRDVMVLQEPTGGQKGVLILKYTETFDAFLAFFDFDQVIEEYFLVLEPSWAGYCDPTILAYLDTRAPVLVQCFTRSDRELIEALDSNLVPVPLGPADWVKPEVFDSGPPSTERDFDVVMVANWGRHKQHRRLFEALRRVPEPMTVLLVGFPWGGRTSDDIRREARIMDPKVDLRIEERIPHPEVADRLRRSRTFVFLSKKEGDNKAVVEAIFSDVPVCVYRDSVGGATSRVNPETGELTSYSELGDTLFAMLSGSDRYSPRKWAERHTGADRSSGILEEHLKAAARSWGQPYEGGLAPKANAPNLTYRNPEDEDRLAPAKARLASALKK